MVGDNKVEICCQYEIYHLKSVAAREGKGSKAQRGGICSQDFAHLAIEVFVLKFHF